MSAQQHIIEALEAAIPGFKAATPATPLPTDDADAAQAWLEELLGEDFFQYVEWKEFSSWGFDGLCALQPFQGRNIAWSADELFDNDAPPEEGGDDDDGDYDDGDYEDEDEDDDPGMFYLKPLNKQLAPYGLAVVELGANENPRLIVVHRDAALIERLSKALASVRVALIEYD